MHFSPIILFIYNRPWHTQQTIEALSKNFQAKQSELFIFADGSKNNNDIYAVQETRNIVKKVDGFKRVHLIERKTNYGLAQNIIQGVTEVINRYDSCIVLEDDLVTSPYFLSYINSALEKYNNSKQLAMIGGWSPKIKPITEHTNDVYLTQRACSWGWATWEKWWNKVDWDVKDYNEFITSQNFMDKFEKRGKGMVNMLKRTKNGKLNTWDIIWDYFLFRSNAYCLRPKISLIKNIGNDGSGSNCGKYDKFKTKLRHDFNPKVEIVPYSSSLDDTFKKIYISSLKDQIMYFLYSYRILK